MIETVPSDATRRLRSLVAARSVADREGVELETVDLDEALTRGPGAMQLTERLEGALAPEVRPDAEIDDPVQYRRALHTLLDTARRAGHKLDADPEAPLTRAELMSFEAVVRADGSRPSLMIRDGRADADHPTAGTWAQPLRDTAPALTRPIAAVGRVEPANATARSFFGTCWVVDAGAGLALTNLHVVEAMWRRLPSQMEWTQGVLRVRDGVFVDFVGESGSRRSNRSRVVEAHVTGIEGTGFERLDAAVLKLEPLSDGEMPAAVPVRADPDGPAGTMLSFCVVGFPGPPARSTGVHGGVDWDWVNRTLFGNRYGIKRLAPGTAHRPLGSLAGDTHQWVFGHDPTTLGGSSGSPLLSWLDGEPSGFGLHFAGVSADTNLAHAIVACADQLRTLGVPVG